MVRLFARSPKVSASADLAGAADPGFMRKDLGSLFQPKGEMELELLVFQSVIGPIGLPAAEAVYPPIVTADGEPMNALHDYVIRMSKDELPPDYVLVGHPLRHRKRFLHPQRPKEIQRGRKRGDEAERGRRYRNLHRRREARRRARGELAAPEPGRYSSTPSCGSTSPI